MKETNSIVDGILIGDKLIELIKKLIEKEIKNGK